MCGLFQNVLFPVIWSYTVLPYLQLNIFNIPVTYIAQWVIQIPLQVASIKMCSFKVYCISFTVTIS